MSSPTKARSPPPTPSPPCAARSRAAPPITASSRASPTPTRKSRRVGLTPALARVSHGEDALDIARFPFEHLDKAIIVGETQGFVQIVSLKTDGTILGAQIVGAHAGRLINEICLAMRARLPVSEIALTMHAYPTLPEAVEAAALSTAPRAALALHRPREMVHE